LRHFPEELNFASTPPVKDYSGLPSKNWGPAAEVRSAGRKQAGKEVFRWKLADKNSRNSFLRIILI
jgi:hypothetical protein